MERLVELLKKINNDIDYYHESDLINSGIFSSFEIMQCLTDIEEEFHIIIPSQEIVPENFSSLEQMWKMILRCRA